MGAATATVRAKVPSPKPPKAKAGPPTWIAKLDTWAKDGQELAKRDARHQWEIATWMFKGEGIAEQAGEEKTQKKVSGKMYNRAEKVTGLDRSTLKTWASVARNVSKLLRNNRLSFYHHKEVADLEPREQKQWLEKAVTDKLSVAALRKAIHASKGTPERAPKTGTPKSVRPIFNDEQVAKISKLAKLAKKTDDDFVRDIVLEYLAKCQ